MLGLGIHRIVVAIKCEAQACAGCCAWLRLQTGNTGPAPLAAKKARKLPPGKAAAITGTMAGQMGAVVGATGAPSWQQTQRSIEVLAPVVATQLHSSSRFQDI